MFVKTVPSVPTITNPDAAEVGLERWGEGAARLASQAEGSGASDESDAGANIARMAHEIAEDPTGRAVLAGLFSASPFLTQLMLRDQAETVRLLTDGPDAAFRDVMAGLATLTPSEMTTANLMARLREARRRAALAIAVGDLLGTWSLEQVFVALSALADRALEASWRHALGEMVRRGKLPAAGDADPLVDSGLVCLAMGKLGARELNYSSDIDLVVFYDDELPLYDGVSDLQGAFVQATRLVVKLMEERTPDGYVFRTDLRLRPDAGAMPLAVSVSAAEAYYEGMGQNWERSAFIRARAVASDSQAAARFLDRMGPFIWRRHLDFAAIRDIHSIKRQIAAHRGGSAIAVEGHNIKLGRGGIREIEFFVHTQQLIWGGRDNTLREAGTEAAILALVRAGRIEAVAGDELLAAYKYLRRLEHCLQMIGDTQTQTMPEDTDGLRTLAGMLGYGDEVALRETLLDHLSRVVSHYRALFEGDAPLTGGDEAGGSLVFTGVENDPETLETLAVMGYSDGAVVGERIRAWHHGRYRATRSEQARQMLTELTPGLLKAFAVHSSNPDLAFSRFDRFLEVVPAGVQLFSLLLANPGLLDLIGDIMGMAPSLATSLGLNPSLFESLLTHGQDEEPGSVDDLVRELEAELGPIPDTGPDTGSDAGPNFGAYYETVLDTVRREVNDRRFQVDIQIFGGRVPPEHSGRNLAAIADAAIRCLLPRVEAEFARRHGTMPGVARPALGVVALGKLGSGALSPRSDLDLIFLHAAPHDGQSDGPSPLGGNHFFIRMSQRLFAALTTQTAVGGLYEVDARLRPDGGNAPLATSLEGFRKYHENSSWTWEHMALTKARVVAGSPDLQAAIEAEIASVLCRPRDPDSLRTDVAEMRLRMAGEQGELSHWSMKHWRGGLIDAEFIVQYLQLLHAADHPEVIGGHTASVCERLAKIGALPADAAQNLAAAVRLYEAMQALLRVTVGDDFDPEAAPASLTARLSGVGGAVDFAALEAKITRSGEQVRALFRDIIDPSAP